MFVSCLLGNGYDPNEMNDKGFTALFYAIGKSFKITKMLINYGADANRPSRRVASNALIELGELVEGRNTGDEYFDSSEFFRFEPNAPLKKNRMECGNTLFVAR